MDWSPRNKTKCSITSWPSWIHGTIYGLFTRLVRKLWRIQTAPIHAITNWYNTQYNPWIIHRWKNSIYRCRQKGVSSDEVLFSQKTPFRILLQKNEYSILQAEWVQWPFSQTCLHSLTSFWVTTWSPKKTHNH